MAPADQARIELRRSSRARATAGSRPRGPRGARAGRAAGAHVRRLRWEGLARAAMLFVLAGLLYLYLSAGAHMFSTWRQERRDNAVVGALEREHHALERQRANLVKRETVELEARRLGMVKKGEQAYVISGLPGGG